MSLKNDAFTLLANHDLQDVLEVMSLILERVQLTKMGAGNPRNEHIEEILHHLELAAAAAEKIDHLGLS